MPTLDDLYEKPSPSKGRPARTGGPTLDQVFASDPQASQGVTPLPETTSEGARGAVQTIAPMLATGGASLATRGMGQLMKFGAEMGAGGLAEAGLQGTGISAQSPEAIGLATAFPGIGRGLVALGGQAARLLPGVQNATRAALVEPMRKMGADLLPAPDPKALYQQLEASNRSMHLSNFPVLEQTVKELGHNVENIPWEQLKQQTKGSGLDNLFGQIEQTLKGTPARIVKQPPTSPGGASLKGTGLPSQPVTVEATPPGMKFEEAQAAVEGLNKVIGSTSDDALRGNYKKLKSAILTDLETMPKPEGTPLALWDQARDAYRKQKTRDIFSDAIERYITPKEGIDQANPDGLLKWLRNSDEMRSRLDPQQFKALEANVQKMASLTGRERSRVLSMLAGLATTGSAGGALVGYLGAEAMSKAMLSEEGKRVVGKMLLNPSESNIRRLGAILGAGTAGAFDAPGPMPMPSVAVPFQEQ